MAESARFGDPWKEGSRPGRSPSSIRLRCELSSSPVPIVPGVIAERVDSFNDWLDELGFAERQRGSHNIFHKEGVLERLVLQRDGSHAKPY